MKVSFETLQETFQRILLGLSFPEEKAILCAHVFAANSRDGVYSHGLNRFPVFVDYVKNGWVDPLAEPEMVSQQGTLEQWDGHHGIGICNATTCMSRAIELAEEHGIGCVALRHTNHWMRGGTYGLQAAEAGCIGICFTNAIAGMPAWGGSKPVLGNNPLVIAIPHPGAPVLLDMALSQFSYGKMQEYEMNNESLPVPGGYDEDGHLSQDPAAIRSSKRALPIGFWKGSGLALVLDMLAATLSGGRSTAKITADKTEHDVSQCFICVHPTYLHSDLAEEIIQAFRESASAETGEKVSYPGENMMRTRLKNMQEGIPVNESIWTAVQRL